MSENELSAAEKLIELSKLCELLALEQSDTPEVHYAEAAAIARELWPVRTKPLVWRNPHGPYVAGDYMIAIDSGGVFRASYNLTQIFGCKAPAHEALAQCQVACEDHHQARFLDQLA